MSALSEIRDSIVNKLDLLVYAAESAQEERDQYMEKCENLESKLKDMENNFDRKLSIEAIELATIEINKLRKAYEEKESEK